MALVPIIHSIVKLTHLYLQHFSSDLYTSDLLQKQLVNKKRMDLFWLGMKTVRQARFSVKDTADETIDQFEL